MADINIDEQAVSPQHIRTYFADGTPQVPATPGGATPTPPNQGVNGSTLILTVYTGSVVHPPTLRAGLVAADDRRDSHTIQMPLFGSFPGGKGIFPFAIGATAGAGPVLSGETLIGATAMVSLTDMVDKTDPAAFTIREATADVALVTLRPSIPVLALVLNTTVEAQNSEIWGFQYQVTVLTRAGDFSNRNSKTPAAFIPPILIGQIFAGQTWNGGVASIVSTGPGTVRGQPQPL